MSKIANRLMMMLVVLASVVALTTYAQSHLTALQHPKLPSIDAEDDFTQSVAPAVTLIKKSTTTEHHAFTGNESNGYMEKKAVVINSYQLQDPREHASQMSFY